MSFKMLILRHQRAKQGGQETKTLKELKTIIQGEREKYWPWPKAELPLLGNRQVFLKFRV